MDDLEAGPAAALVQGYKDGGMAAVGKHFPGHGYVRADSHHELPRDDRPYAEMYTPAAREIVEHAYRRELDRFGYAFLAR